MDRMTLTVVTAAAALLMFAIGWTACWIWFRLRAPYADARTAADEAPQTAEKPDEQRMLDELNRLEAEFAGEKGRPHVPRQQQLDRDAFDRPV